MFKDFMSMIRNTIVKRNENSDFVAGEWIANKETRQIGQFFYQSGDTVQMIADGKVVTCNRADVSWFKFAHTGVYCEVQRGDAIRLALVVSETSDVLNPHMPTRYELIEHNPSTRSFVTTTAYAHQIITVYSAVEQQEVQYVS